MRVIPRVRSPPLLNFKIHVIPAASERMIAPEYTATGIARPGAGLGTGGEGGGEGRSEGRSEGGGEGGDGGGGEGDGGGGDGDGGSG